MSTLGFDISEDTFHFFASKGKILLLLDALDEVKEELREGLISDVESLIRRHDQLNVIMTSRPESGAAMSPFLRVFRVCELANREFEEVIRKMAHDQPTADSIIHGIRKDSASISQLLTTPLMVALLMIRYKIDQSLPQNSAAFYDSLFSLLLQRHDKSKSGYVRPRKSAAGDIALQDFFNALSYVTRKVGDTSFTQSQLITHSRSAANLINIKEDIENLLKDITDITCLIIKDGEESKFIHKIVQEYHAALFIKEQPDETALQFYRSMKLNWKQWPQELRFLNQIDRYRYLKNFYIAALKSALEIKIGDESWKNDASFHGLTDEVAIRIFGKDRLNFHSNKINAPQSMTIDSCSMHWPLTKYINGSVYIREMFVIPNKCFEGALVDEGVQRESLTVKEMIESSKCHSRALAACSSYYKRLIDDLKSSEEFVAQVESMKSAFEF